MHLPAAIYLRISDDPLNLRAGVARQRQDCTAIAATRYPSAPIREYLDNDISAYTGVTRPAYQQLLADIAAGTICAAIAWDQDRLLRLGRELEPLIDLCTAHSFTTLVTASGELDLTTHEGQFRARIMVAVAQKSSDDTSRRVRRAALDRKERGLWVGGPPYGYTRLPGSRLQIDATAAATITEAITLLRRGESLRGLCRAFPDGPATGPSWVKALTNPALCGLNRQGIVGEWEPIITPVQHADLVAHFRDPLRRTSNKTSYRTHWLTGVLSCGKCGGDPPVTLTFQPMSRSKAGNYICTTCFGVSVSAAAIEPYITDLVFVSAPERESAAAVRGETTAAVLAAEVRLSEMARMYGAGELTDAEWLAGKRGVEESLRSLPVVRSTAATETRDQLSPDWADRTPAHKHRTALQYFRHVPVLPGKRGSFDAGRVGEPEAI